MAVGRDKRRIMVTVSKDVAEALERLRNITGLAASTFIGQLVDENLAALQGMVEAVEEAAAARDPTRAVEGLRRVLQMASVGMDQATLELDQIEAKATTRSAITSVPKAVRERKAKRQLRARERAHEGARGSVPKGKRGVNASGAG